MDVNRNTGGVCVSGRQCMGIWCVLISLIVINVRAQSWEDARDNAANDAVNPLARMAKVQGEPNFTWADDDGRVIYLGSRVFYPGASIGLPFVKSDDPDKIYTVYRFDAPIVGQTFPKAPEDDAVGLSDMTMMDIVVFKLECGMFGVGPGLIIPVGEPEVLSTGKWSAGPVVAFINTRSRGFLWGALLQQYFSFAGQRGRSQQNIMLVQPIVNKLLGKGKFLSFSSVFRFDWENDTYNIPVGISFGKAFARNLSLLFGPEYVIAGPGKGDFTFKFQINAMFPSGE